MGIRHFVLDLSAHGFGHIAQSAAVVKALKKRLPGLKLTIRSTASRAILESRFGMDFELVHAVLDFGLVMNNAIDIDIDASRAAYCEFHRNWDDRVFRQAQALARLKPDLLLANVPYLSLAAAARAGIDSVGFCSLNWADLYRHYCLRDEQSREINQQISEAYRQATRFLELEPGMPMSWMNRVQRIGPVAEPGRNRREPIAKTMGLGAGERIGLISMGGMPFPVDFGKWPKFRGIRWLASCREGAAHPDFFDLERLSMPFSDILASADLLVTKPGYGSFVEAAACGVPVLYLDRHDWPEAPYLVSWLKQAGSALEISREAYLSGEIQEAAESLLAGARPVPIAASGAEQAAACIEAMLT